MQSSPASSISTALSVEPETRGLGRGCQSAAHPHNLLVFRKKGRRKKKKKRKHQNSRVRLRCFTEERARGEMTLFGAAAAQRINGLMGVFFPWALAPRQIARRCQVITCDTRARTRKHGAAPSQTSQCFVPGAFIFSPRHQTMKATITSIINYAFNCRGGTGLKLKKGGWRGGRKSRAWPGQAKRYCSWQPAIYSFIIDVKVIGLQSCTNDRRHPLCKIDERCAIMWWTHERRGHAANDSLETSIARQAGSQKARSPFKDSIPQLTLIVAVRIAWIFISDNNCLLPRHILALLPTTGTGSRQHRLSVVAASGGVEAQRGHAQTHGRWNVGRRRVRR